MIQSICVQLLVQNKSNNTCSNNKHSCFTAVKQQLLELGDKIGYVSTGLKEDEISRCLRKIKGSIMNDLPPNLPMHVDKKCSICQVSFSSELFCCPLIFPL